MFLRFCLVSRLRATHLFSFSAMPGFDKNMSFLHKAVDYTVCIICANRISLHVFPSGWHAAEDSFNWSVLEVGFGNAPMTRTISRTHCMHSSFMHAFIHAFIHQFIHACIHACIHSFIHACIHPSIHPFIHSSMHAVTNAFIQSCIHA